MWSRRKLGTTGILSSVPPRLILILLRRSPLLLFFVLSCGILGPMAQQSPMPPSSLSRLVVPAASGSHFTCCNDHYTSLPARRDRHSRTPSAPMPYVGDIERHGACLSDLESIYTRRGLSWTETDKTCGELRAAASGAAEADPQPGLATDDPRAVATGLGEERGASGHWPGERAPAQCDVEQGSASVMLRPAAKKHKKRLIIKKHRVCAYRRRALSPRS
jgi:hypothetical protein